MIATRIKAAAMKPTAQKSAVRVIRQRKEQAQGGQARSSTRNGATAHQYWCKLRTLAVFSLAALALAACSTAPTPYQKLGEEGGYESSRLQERIFRVSFKGNRHTPETDVLDFLFLRCAELTRKHGFTHFVIQEDYGRTQMQIQSHSSRSQFGFGFGMSNRRSFWGVGFSSPPPPDYSGTISYHLALFVIKMLKPEEASSQGDKAFDAKFMIESLAAKKKKSLPKGS